MNIEFHTQAGGVREWILGYIRDKLMGFHYREKDITKARVYLGEQKGNGENNIKVCEMELAIYGGSLYVQRKAPGYEQAVKEVLEQLTIKIEEWHKNRNEPPDEITSTVRV
ncbi:MAG: hypothetical protein QM731_08730 [Chitinophagaceae bacterium]